MNSEGDGRAGASPAVFEEGFGEALPPPPDLALPVRLGRVLHLLEQCGVPRHFRVHALELREAALELKLTAEEKE